MGELVEKEWAEKLERFLKAELKRAKVTYEGLAVLLQEMGLEGETKASIASKLGRGSFSAVFMMAALKAIGRESINLSDL